MKIYRIHSQEDADLIPDVVQGNLWLYEQCTLPNLTRIEGSLWIKAKCSLPNLTHTKGSCYIEAKCSLPNLTHTKGGLWIEGEHDFSNIKAKEIIIYPNSITRITLKEIA